MPRTTVTRVEGLDEETALKAMQLAEKGPVSFSDKYTYKARVDDPEEVANLIEASIARNIKFVVERVS